MMSASMEVVEGLDLSSTPPLKKAKLQESPKVELRRVWHDPDDDIPDEEGISGRRVKTLPRLAEPYRVRCVEDFERVFGATPEWAKLDKSSKKKRRDSLDSEDEEGEEFSDFGSRSGRGSVLPQGQLRLIRVADLNGGEQRQEGYIIRSIEFNNKNAVALVAGASGVVSLYQVDGVNNPHLQSVTIENYHVGRAMFGSCGERVFVSSPRVPHYYGICLATGNLTRVRPSSINAEDSVKKLVVAPDGRRLISVGGKGSIYILSENTGEVVGTIEVPGDIRDICFSGKDHLLILNGEGKVFVFDWRSTRAVTKFSPDGIFDPTCLTVSSHGLMSIGSGSGIVSMFKKKEESWDPKPIAELGNLTTEVTELAFNSSGEILALSSTEKDNAIRLMHTSSNTVFQGFPHVTAQWGRPNCISFSPGSGFFALGNNRGRALLFRLRHFGSY